MIKPIVAMALLLATTVATAQLTPYQQGRSARLSGNLPVAEAKLRAAIVVNPDDYLALYNLGLVFIARAEAVQEPSRTANYQMAISWLERARRVREARKIDEFTIYNTLGTVYFSVGDNIRAEQVWKLGLSHSAKLTTASQAKLNSNLGYFYGVQGKPTEANKYLTKGAQLGSRSAQINLVNLNTVVRQTSAPLNGTTLKTPVK